MPDKNLFESAVESLPESDHRLRAWLAMLGCFTSVERSLRRRFNRVFHSSLPRYDVLTALVQFPDGLTMGQLASKLMVSAGNITGVVKRLQAHRYVTQARSPEDGRVQVVTVTGEGRALWEKMHSEYRSVIEEVLSQLSGKDATTMTKRLIKVQEGIDSVLQRDESSV